MKKRLPQHFARFTVLTLFIITSVFIYIVYYLSLPKSLDAVFIAFGNYLDARYPNLILIALLTYLLQFLTGLSEHRHLIGAQKMAHYLGMLLRLFLILAVVSFIEFYLFFSSKVGRVVYLFVFILYAIYYLVLTMIPYVRPRQRLRWGTRVAPEDFLDNYAVDPKIYDIVPMDTLHQLETNELLVYRSDELADDTSEFLIRNKLDGYPVVELIDLVEAEAEKIPLDYVNIHWLLDKFHVAKRNYMRFSRIINIGASVMMLLFLCPPALALALIHRLTSKGPLLYVQERVGLNWKPFKLYKFRTMRVDAEKDGARFTSENDHRVNAVGRLLRRSRLDEVPQLFNILKGHMNLVGPRPERPIFAKDLAAQIPYYHLRFLVKPGLTGWAQVKGGYAGNDLADHKRKLEYDLFYIKNRRLALDLLILIKTTRIMFQAKGK